nr:hypothetical protein KPHV_00960 [Kitasatospora purpeofusca]
MIGDADADAFELARSTWDAVVPTGGQGIGTQAGGLPTPSATMTRIAAETAERAMNDGKEAEPTMPLHLDGHRWNRRPATVLTWDLRWTWCPRQPHRAGRPSPPQSFPRRPGPSPSPRARRPRRSVVLLAVDPRGSGPPRQPRPA